MVYKMALRVTIWLKIVKRVVALSDLVGMMEYDVTIAEVVV